MSALAIGEDGFYHPEDEAQVIALVKRAVAEGLQIRCRGAVHSLAHSIYTDPGATDPPVRNTVSEPNPPKGPNLNLMFDRMNRLEWVGADIVEVEAGIHLGPDPGAPAGTATLEQSLLYQIFLRGYTLRDLGGITHQTISGFLAMGCSGGSLMYGLEENIQAFRVVDGLGNAVWAEKESDLFAAVGVSMGLQGIITRVRLKLTPLFSVYGQERTTAVADSPIDLFGDGTPGTPSLRTFLEQTPYSRLLWWPQPGAERIVTWMAVSGPPLNQGVQVPYAEFGTNPADEQVQELAAAILFTLAGNLDDLSVVPKKLNKDFKSFEDALDLVLEKLGLPEPFAKVLADLLGGAGEVVTDAEIRLLAPAIKEKLPDAFAKIVDLFQPLTGKDGPKTFQDWAWRSLPMDNAASDVMLGTEFTEIWIPLEHTAAAMRALRDHFVTGGHAATGYNATELYAAMATKFWLSPSYGQAVFRVDPFWYIGNAGSPAGKGGFYDGFWMTLRNAGIPFRLHWAKWLPEYDLPEWAEYLRSQYPRWDDWMAMRRQQDPHDIFLTDYWRGHLGIAK